MTRKISVARLSVGQLVDAAYKEAGRLTRNRRLAALIANRLIQDVLSSSDRPDLVQQLHDAGS